MEIRPDIDTVLRENLTYPQYDAATDEAREVLCLACAGSGKSRTLAFRIARLIAQGAPPESIVAFTFTDKAAETIKLRVAQALRAAGFDPTIIGAMYIGTIHSYCGNVLSEMDARYRQFDKLDENKLKLYLMSRYPQLQLLPVRQEHGAGYFETIKEVSEAWKILNDELLSIDDVARYDFRIGQALASIRTGLERDQFIDFSLMIRLAVEALENRDEGALRVVEPLRHLMVDEYQDVNPAQEALIRELHRHSDTLFVVGDDDQSIYAWRGADVSNIKDFAARYPNSQPHTLARNFRSTSAIVRAADHMIHDVLGPTRIPKNPHAARNREPRDFRSLHFDTRAEEAEWVAERIQSLLGTRYVENNEEVRGLTPADFAILMQSTGKPEQDGTARHTAFTEALRARNIPFSIDSTGSIFDRPQVRALRESFYLLRDGMPDMNQARRLFDSEIHPTYPHADFNSFGRVLANWGRLIHAPIAGPRRRVYPQQLVHDLLEACGIGQSNFDDPTMRDIGVFSGIMKDVESVYLSIDTTRRYQQITYFLERVAESGYSAGSIDVIHRPDAVTVSTVHKAKGLEFPVVFIADAQSGRMPARRRNYRGWLPTEVLAHALNRGAYQNTHDEQARVFYTALTRAERFLYVTGCTRLPGGVQQNRRSPYAQRLLIHELLEDGEVSTDPDGLPDGLEHHPPRRRIDETMLPTSFSEIRYYLRCPQDYRFRKLLGFSPTIKEMLGFGVTVHSAVGRLHQLYQDAAPSGDEAEEIARDIFHLKHVPQSGDPVNNPGPYERAHERATEIVREYAEEYREDFEQLRQVEARFEIPVEQAVISGSIDLLLKEDPEGNILEAEVVDFKTMEGGDEPATNPDLDWTELALQVQLYAQAADEIFGELARTGSVHLLKDNQRVEVPVNDEAVEAAVANVEWAVERVLAGDFPMRPKAGDKRKCDNCDFKALCPKQFQSFAADEAPPPIHLSGGERRRARAFSEVDEPTP